MELSKPRTTLTISKESKQDKVLLKEVTDHYKIIITIKGNYEDDNVYKSKIIAIKNY